MAFIVERNPTDEDDVPAPPRTSRAEIVASARRIAEESGVDGLTMQAVAEDVGVRAPSLYKRVQDRADLVRLAVQDVAEELGGRLAALETTGDPATDLRRLARTFRVFAHQHPVGYGLLFVPLPDGSRLDPTVLAESSRPVLDVVAQLAGEDRALEAARTVVAWARGFVGMELSGAFRLGGEVERAWEFGLERLVAAISMRPAPG